MYTFVLMMRNSQKSASHLTYGMASISRLLKIKGLACKRAPQKRRYSAKETYNFKEPTNRSHPIANSEATRLLTSANSQKRRYSAKETCNFKEPTHPSHPMVNSEATRLLRSANSQKRRYSAKETHNFRFTILGSSKTFEKGKFSVLSS